MVYIVNIFTNSSGNKIHMHIYNVYGSVRNDLRTITENMNINACGDIPCKI